MNSNQVKLWAAVAQITNALNALLPYLSQSFPKTPPAVSVAISGIIMAIYHYASAQVTPITNANTPDNIPVNPQPPVASPVAIPVVPPAPPAVVWPKKTP